MNGLYGLKAWFTRMLAPILSVAVRLRLSPDLFTVLGLAGAGLAAWATTQLVGWLVLLGLVVRLAGANLDGAVARARGLASSRRGFCVNEIGDRGSDLLVMVPMAGLAEHLIAADGLLGIRIAAVVAANLPTAVSLLGHARVGVRLNGGPVGKTERCALIALAVFALQFGAPAALTLTIFYVAIIVGSVLTALLRERQICRLEGMA